MERLLAKPVEPVVARSGRARPIASIHHELCIACGACETACPTRAITVTTTATVQGSRCIGCAECVDVCPVEAISMIGPEQVPETAG